jgi:transcription initiation factor TFIIE subunit alpha
MDKKLIKEAFVEVASKQAEPLVDFLDTKKYMNEFLIAKKLDLPINQTRNVLYKISEYGLVSSTRKKDKKKGWYTYSWKIEELKCLEFLRNILLKKMEQLKNQIKNRESKEFYVCERCHVEFNEENALLHDFTCPECGSLLERKDNSKLIKEFRKNLENYETILKTVDGEIDKEQTIEAKKIKVKAAAVKRTKAKERAEARAKAKKALIREEKKKERAKKVKANKKLNSKKKK